MINKLKTRREIDLQFKKDLFLEGVPKDKFYYESVREEKLKKEEIFKVLEETITDYSDLVYVIQYMRVGYIDSMRGCFHNERDENDRKMLHQLKSIETLIKFKFIEGLSRP